MGQNKQNETLYRVAKVFISFFMLFSAYFSYTHGEDLKKTWLSRLFQDRIGICQNNRGDSAFTSLHSCKGKRMGICRIYHFHGFCIDSPYM